jgi:hypothetical protein
MKGAQAVHLVSCLASVMHGQECIPHFVDWQCRAHLILGIHHLPLVLSSAHPPIGNVDGHHV